MSHARPSKNQLSKWKKSAKKLHCELDISYKDALNKIAKDNGFKSWRHVKELRDKKSSLNERQYVNLPKKVLKAIDKGESKNRTSYLALTARTAKSAKKELCDQLEDIIRNSRLHKSIDVHCYISKDLAENITKSMPTLFEDIYTQYGRLNSLNIVIDDNGIPLEVLLMGSGGFNS